MFVGARRKMYEQTGKRRIRQAKTRQRRVIRWMMKTTKILFTRESAIAYSDGRKCRTQRVMKVQPDSDTGFFHQSKDGTWFERHVGVPYYSSRYGRCPYGQPGDRLQLLTSWAVPKEYDGHKPSDLLGSDLHCEDIWTYFDSDQKPECLGRLRSPLFMPGWLRDVMPHPKILSIEARRLHEITDEECLEEGFAYEMDLISKLVSKWSYGDSKMPNMREKGRDWYKNLWDSINAKRGYPWKSNPWVWNIKIDKLNSQGRKNYV